MGGQVTQDLQGHSNIWQLLILEKLGPMKSITQAKEGPALF